MSIPRVKSSGWATNEKLTSGQMSEVDEHTSWALDKRSGQTDTLASTVTATGPIAFQGTTTHTGASSFASTVTFGALSSVSFSGFVSFGGASSVFFNNGSTVSGVVSVSALTTTTGTWDMQGTVKCLDLQLNGTTRVKYFAPRTISRVVATIFTDSQWVPSSSGRFSASSPSILTDSSNALFILDDMPDGCMLDTVALTFKPASGHTGIPEQVPQISVYRTDVTTGTATLLGTANDNNTASIFAYEGFTTLTVNPSIVVDRTKYKYTCYFLGEGGNDARNGLTLHGCIVTFTATQMDRF